MSLVPHRLQGFWWYPFGGKGAEKNHKRITVGEFPVRRRINMVRLLDDLRFTMNRFTYNLSFTSFLFHSTGSLPWPVALMLCITQSTTLRGILWYKLKKTKIKGCVRACVCQLRAGKQPCAICVACINGATHSTHRPQAFKQAYVTTLVRLLDSVKARCQGAGPCDCSSLQLVGCSPASSPGTARFAIKDSHAGQNRVGWVRSEEP